MESKYTYQAVSTPDSILNCGMLRNINPVFLDILYKRGYKTETQVQQFLFPDVSSILQDLDVKGMDIAVNLLERHIKANDRIIIYRDYDCDGCASGAIAVECLHQLGAKVEHYANKRSIDGYGLCKQGIENILTRWPDTKVVVTVDNGISAHSGIDYAKSLGLTVIVTDHHECGKILPSVDAIVNPKRPDETCSFRDLCGAGVTFKLMLALYKHMGKHIEPVIRTLDLVALATVADVVPVISENRFLVQEGLKQINAGNRPFFAALLSKGKYSNINAHQGLAFGLVPMVNSISRLDLDTDIVVEMMLSKDMDRVNALADLLISTNDHRKQVTKDAYELIQSQLPEPTSADFVIVVRNDSLPDGIIGIIAGRLKEQYNLPCVVATANGDGTIKASARSPEWFHLKEALDQISDGILLGYGGHAQAAGFSVTPDKFNAFIAEFTQLARHSAPKDTVEVTREIDAVLSELDFSRAFVQELQILEPFGSGFPPLLFGLKADPTEVVYMGQQKQHVKYKTASGLDIIQFGQGDQARRRAHFPRKFVGSPSLNIWNKTVTVQFVCE